MATGSELIGGGSPFTLYLYFEDGLSSMVMDITTPWGTMQVESMDQFPQLLQMLKERKGDRTVDVDTVCTAVGRPGSIPVVRKTPTLYITII